MKSLLHHITNEYIGTEENGLPLYVGDTVKIRTTNYVITQVVSGAKFTEIWGYRIGDPLRTIIPLTHINLGYDRIGLLYKVV